VARLLLLLAVLAVPLAVFAVREAGLGSSDSASTTRTDVDADDVANAYQLYLAPLSAGEPRAVDPPSARPYLVFSPSWAPDGKALAVTEIDCHNCAPQVRLVSLARGATPRRPLARGSQPSFAPDGRRIAYVDGDGGLAIIGVDGRNRKTLVPADRGSVMRPRFSRQGDRIAFMRQDERGRWHVWTISPSGGNLVRLTSGSRPETDPAWTADGRSVVFARQAQNGLWHLHRVSRNGGAARRLGSAATSDSHPSFTPDGRRVVFVRQNGSRFSLVVGSLDGGGRTLNVAPLTDVAEPAVSPDGTTVAFIARRPPAAAP
jgi:Tol biopolymer transport system component